MQGALSIAPGLLVAFLLGAIVGAERQWHQRYTGLATHTLVAVGAAAFTSIAGLVSPVSDATRLGGQVITGIGFLGAGLIMRDGFNVRGLSAAASVWATGAIGALAGYGLLLEAAETTVLIMVANLVLPRLGRLIDATAPEREQTERFYTIELRCDAQDEAVVRTKLLQAMNVRKLRLHGLESHAIAGKGEVQVEAVVYSARQEDSLVEQLVGELSLSPRIFSTRWISAATPL
ncbi:MgtC/SapB family protein [Roseomonas aerophila]|uniref:Protein MgtC n=1 Tax=Teichococcus aerophilus TaxID=1224513 RepID=A0ABR7RNZ0_9PROT|nr:MgtC/SapB family protein [Pseudoroseomonas aerophila]MBC9208143.1 MgtC/SapB family protein [Pseudoroseomonas aerophila]